MSRWMIEKSGTGIEKSGTGIEKSGTGIEKSGTGIEKSGTGIEKSGTGIRRGLLACSIAALAFTTQVNASEIRPEGLMQVIADQGQISVMWNIDGNTFVGKGSQNGTFTQVSLFEISINNDYTAVEIAGGGTGVEIAGGGTGNEILIAGGGTGNEAISITLPNGTGLEMEISLGCQTASVSVLDSNFTEVVSFNNIQVMGNTGLCQSGGNIQPWSEEKALNRNSGLRR